MRLRAAAWMAFLGPFFFLIYGACNWITAQRSGVGSFYWSWELAIPFVPAMIVPYMSLDLFYAGSTFLCRTRQEIHVLARRMVFAILVAAVCFLIFPLKIAFVRPPTPGFFGVLFDWLRLDQPYNLVPSLHMTLRAIVWVPYGRVLTGLPRTLAKMWFVLIALSAVLTYQHQVLDIICGEILAVIAFYLLPENGPFPIRFRQGSRNWKYAALYGASTMLLTAAAIVLRPWGTILLWPAVSLGLVAVAYMGAGPAIFQKREGVLSWSARILLAPYLAGKAISCRFYHRSAPQCLEVAANVVVGGWLDARDPGEFGKLKCTAVLDLTAEFSEWRRLRTGAYKNIQVLDLTLPAREDVRRAVEFIKDHAERGRVYVHCALGYSRSAGIAAAYMLATGGAETAGEAVAKIRGVRPQIVLRQEWMELLREFAPDRQSV